MKIIDILNKIANNEQPPKKIVFKDEVYEYDETDGDYRNNNYEALFDYHEITDILNDEVQILETTITYNQDNFYQYQPYTGEVEIKCNSPKNILESDKIEKIPIKDMKIQATSTNNYCYSISQPMKIIINKINEIIDHINCR